MILALFWSFQFYELLWDIQPVSQATLHDTLNEHDFLLSSPIPNQEGEVHVVKNEVIVVWFMRVILGENWILFMCMFGDCTKT